MSFKKQWFGWSFGNAGEHYYGFGLIVPNSPAGTTATSNKQLYNGGSEWQNDYSNLPDYYET